METVTYKNWLKEIKEKIKHAQIKSSVQLNSVLIQLYWDIGGMIVAKQSDLGWGAKIIDKVAIDLKREFPDTSGFSRTNLFSMRKFFLFYSEPEILHQVGGLLQATNKSTGNQEDAIVHQLGGQLATENLLLYIPWRHHVLILNSCTSVNEAIFYIKKTIQNNWSRNILRIQIDSELHNRQGKAITNFKLTLPKPQSDLAIETLKDPYKFDFLTLEENVQELELEKRLTDNITKLLLEMGKGFAFMGRQYPLNIGRKERKIDLLFYHTKMHCYVVIDLKTGEFEPEHVGKMNYYLSAVDDLLKTEMDNPSIGIVLCKTKDNLDVEYTLRDMKKPLGVSEFTFNELPVNLQENLPTVSEIENEFKNISNDV